MLLLSACNSDNNTSSTKKWTVTANASAGGHITPTSSIVPSGQTISLSLTPENGYQIGTVSGCSGTLNGSIYTTAAITENCTVTASFDAFYAVTAIAGTGGVITPSTQTSLASTRAILTVIPDSNYILDELSGCGITPDGSQWKTETLTNNCTVTAKFRPKQSLFAGGSSTCSLLDDSGNTINKCWGQNSSGQLGTLSFSLTAHGDEAGEAPRDNDSMTLISDLNILSMDLGSQHACAVMSDNNVYCWGENQNGQLGIGTNSDQKIMNLMVNLDDEPVAEVSAGGQFTCARQFNGKVRCWGLNSSGELGIGTSNTWFIPPPVIPTLADNAVQITTGAAHACARLSNNQIQCWGDNSSGQLGNSDGGNDSSTPTNVALTGTITDVSAGGLFTCVIVDGNVKCWGENGSGQLGNNDGTNTDLDVPSASLDINGEVPIKLATGSEHACVLTQTGKVYCWGESDAGQTGQNDTTDDITPQLVDLGSNYTTDTVINITAGGDHTCVELESTNPLITGHPVRCWGEGGVGQLGLESTDDIGDNEIVDNDAFDVLL